MGKGRTSMSHITTEDPATLRLPFKEKLSYGIGDLASNILLDIGTLYLLKFYTDVPKFFEK